MLAGLAILLLVLGLALALTPLGRSLGTPDAFGFSTPEIGWILVVTGLVLGVLSVLIPRIGLRARRTF